MFSWPDNFHRPFNEVMVNSSFEVSCFRFELNFPWSEIFVGKKPGSFGLTSFISLPNIWITDVMVGLSSGYCCTHNRLTWMHRSTSETTHELFMLESINSKAFCSFQSVHAWNMKENRISYSCSNSTIINKFLHYYIFILSCVVLHLILSNKVSNCVEEKEELTKDYNQFLNGD